MDATTTDLKIEITDAALAQIRAALDGQGLAPEERNLRLFVESAGGCCGGMSYGLAFDTAEERDNRIDRGGVTVLIDPVSATYLNGSTVDFIETPEVTGFKVTAPRMEAGGCSSGGCGSSGSCESEQDASCGSGSGRGGCGSGGCG